MKSGFEIYPTRIHSRRTVLLFLFIFTLVFGGNFAFGKNANDKRCATDSTYKYLEGDQHKAYMKYPRARKLFLSPEVRFAFTVFLATQIHNPTARVNISSV